MAVQEAGAEIAIDVREWLDSQAAIANKSEASPD
jgi:endogenous inhibitor of DNA gyrase (YacG/DUF329 family)